MGTLSDAEGYLLIHGINHWYKIAGSQHNTIPIVVLHGGPGGNQYILERTLGPKLAENFTIILYEQRGCGRSGRPENPEDYSIAVLVQDLEGLRRKLGIEKMYLLGTSFGSWIAMEYSLTYADRVEKLILQGPVDGNWQRLSINQIWGLYYNAGENIKESIFKIIAGNAPIEVKKEAVWNIVDEQTIAKFSVHNHSLILDSINLMRESGKYGANEDFHTAITKAAMSYPALIDRIKLIHSPTMIIVGLYDRNTGIEMGRDIAERIPGSRLVILYNSAHYPECEELENYLKEITDFIK